MHGTGLIEAAVEAKEGTIEAVEVFKEIEVAVERDPVFQLNVFYVKSNTAYQNAQNGWMLPQTNII